MAFRAGFIGNGEIMQVLFLPALEKIEEVEPVALYGRNIPRLKDSQHKFSIPHLHQDWRDLLAKHRLNMAVIAVPTKFNFDIACEALSRNLHLVLEKPAVLNAAQGEQLLSLARAKGCHVVINMTLRFLPIIQAAKELIKNNIGNNIVKAEIEYSITRPWQEWYQDKDLAGGGVTMCIGTHAVDLMSYLLDKKIAEINITSPDRITGSEVEGNATLEVIFADHFTAKCETTWDAPAFLAHAVFQGEKNRVEVFLSESQHNQVLLNGTPYYTTLELWSEALDNNALSHLTDLLNQKVAAMSGLDDHMDMLRPLLAGYERFRKDKSGELR